MRLHDTRVASRRAVCVYAAADCVLPLLLLLLLFVAGLDGVQDTRSWGRSIPDMTLVGHEDQAQFPLATARSRPIVASGAPHPRAVLALNPNPEPQACSPSPHW